MKELKLEETVNGTLKSCSVISPGKTEALEAENLEDSFSSPTPVRIKEPSRLQTKEELTELPEKYRMLSEFFDRMISSIRLLRLRKRAPYFKNVSSQVEILTGRKFLVMHLAQINFILPEALLIEKILVHDEKTKCMMPEIKIELLFDAVEGHSEESEFVALCKLFSSRLRGFYLKHLEDSDVPEAVLPDPFNRRSVPIKEEPIPADLSSSFEMERVNPSHIPPRRPSDQEAVAAESENNYILPIKCVDSAENERPKSLPDSSSKAGNVAIKGDPNPADFSASFETQTMNPSHFSPAFIRHFDQNAVFAPTEKGHLFSPVNCVDNEETERPKVPPNSSFHVLKVESTPIKLVPESNSLLVETPVQSTPMRSISPSKSVLTCEDKEKKTLYQKSKQPTATAKKSLDFYGIDGEGTTVSNKQGSVSLFDLVQLIHQVFLSVNFRPITKEELVQKIIMNDCEIDDFSDVETQMEHLEKLVPDWFFKKLAPSGDLLYNVKRVSDLDSIRDKIDVI